jgi:uncharacterized damage-inducible protein DinB
MAMNTGLAMELKHEAGNTRKMLERVPFDKATWKPHEKSTNLLSLATHVARVPMWVSRVITMNEFDMAVPGAFPKYEPYTDVKQLLEHFDHNVAEATKNLEAATDESLLKEWIFRAGPQVIFKLPRIAAVRDMGMSHHIHHRGQLSVYLRLLGVPVPGMYGPSADEPRM